MPDARPIGLFDSGVGGLTVLREVMRRLPSASTIYLGDNARAPYGTRSDDEVRRFSVQALDALVGRKVKALVVDANNQGIPFVLAEPNAPVSQDMMRLASALTTPLPGAAGAGIAVGARR